MAQKRNNNMVGVLYNKKNIYCIVDDDGLATIR